MSSVRAAEAELLELRAPVFFPQWMKKWRPTDVLVFSREEERSKGLFEAQGAAESGQTQAACASHLFLSHWEQQASLCELRALLDNPTLCPELLLYFQNNILEQYLIQCI